MQHHDATVSTTQSAALRPQLSLWPWLLLSLPKFCDAKIRTHPRFLCSTSTAGEIEDLFVYPFQSVHCAVHQIGNEHPWTMYYVQKYNGTLTKTHEKYSKNTNCNDPDLQVTCLSGLLCLMLEQRPLHPFAAFSDRALHELVGSGAFCSHQRPGNSSISRGIGGS